MSGMDTFPSQDEYENAMEGDMDFNKKIIKLGELNELVNEDLILLINTCFFCWKNGIWSGEDCKECRLSQGKIARLHGTGW